MNIEKAGPWIPVLFFVLFFGCMFSFIFVDLIAYWDLAPASGTATGFIAYQEKSGIYQLEWVCWRDTQYDYCEVFDPDGKTYAPGRYTMHYECSTFVWAWEHPDECRIVNATRIGDLV